MQPRRFIITFLALAVSVSAGRTIYQLWRRQDVLKSRESELIRLQDTNKILERTLQDMGSESYVEMMAREKLGLVREGETIVILQNSEFSTQNSEQKVTRSNWRRWWGLFF